MLIDIQRALRWMADEGRTVAYLARQCGVDENQLNIGVVGAPDARR